MTALSSDPAPNVPNPPRVRHQFDRAWLFLVALFVIGFAVYLVNGNDCGRQATDFRGYYAAAQIARQVGIGAVYDPQIQAEYQAALRLRCPDGTDRPPSLGVMVPYLSAFIPLLLPLSTLDMTSSYVLWSLANLAILAIYLRRFSIALTGRTNNFKLIQWVICFPVLANLVLGQVNVMVVIILGEFSLAFVRGKPLLSGVWAGFLLLKPHLLILLLPGLLITRSWRVLLGFIATLVFLLVGSLLLAGVDGMFAWLGVIRSFSEASFHSLPNMMNGRGLAFNLARVFTTWAAWLIAIPLMMMVAVFTLRLWKHRRLPEKFLWLMLATLAGTFIVSWHSDLYLWICLIPFLYSLDIQGEVPTPFLGVWVFGPPVIFLLVYLVRLELAQPALAMAMLGFNLFLLGFSARRLVLTFERWHDG